MMTHFSSIRLRSLLGATLFVVLGAAYLGFAPPHAQAAGSCGPFQNYYGITETRVPLDVSNCSTSCLDYATSIGSPVSCEIDQSVMYVLDNASYNYCLAYYGPYFCSPSMFMVPQVYNSACYASTGTVIPASSGRSATTCPYNPPLQINSFTATPNTVSNGSYTTLTWNTQGAASCNSSDFSTGGQPSGSATFQVNIGTQTSKAYTITCLDGAARPMFASVTVYVSNPSTPATCTAWNDAKTPSGSILTLGPRNMSPNACLAACAATAEAAAGPITCGLYTHYDSIGNTQGGGTTGGGSTNSYTYCGYVPGNDQTMASYGSHNFKFNTGHGTYISNYSYSPAGGWTAIGPSDINEAWNQCHSSADCWAYETGEAGIGAATCTSSIANNPNLIAGNAGAMSSIAGQPVTLTGTISNTGTGPTGTSYNTTIFVRNSDNSPRTSFTSPRPGLAAGSSDAFTHDFTGLPAGTYNYYTCADQDSGGSGTISETNESDNCGAAATITIYAPLTASCSVSPTSATTGQAVTWSASVSGGSGAYSYAWTGSDSLSGSSASVSKAYTASGTKTGSVYVASTDGQTTGWISCASSVSVSGPVTPTGVTASCAAPNRANVSWNSVPGASYYMPRFTVANASECPAGWQMWTDGTTCFPNPDTWAQTSVTNFPIVPGRTYHFWVHSTNGVDVSSPAETYFSCNAPNLVASAISPTKSSAGATTFTSTVTNVNGTATPVGFKTLFQRANDAGGSGATDVGTYTHAALGGGGSATASISVSYPVGTYYMRACADKASSGDPGSVTETEEADNCGAWTAISIVPPSPTNLSYTCDASGTNAIMHWDTMPGASFYYVRFSKNGSCPAGWFEPSTAPGLCQPSVDNVPTNTVTIPVTPGVTYSNWWVHSASPSGDWSAETYGGPFGCAGAADLTAGNVTPTSATKGAPVTLSAQGSNQAGSTATSAAFPVLFQIANNVANPQAGDIIDNVNSAYGPTLAPGAASTFTKSYTFNTTGTYKIRACANMNTSGTFIAPESDYADNCGTWSTFIVSLPAPTCSLSADGPIAPTTLHWSSTNAASCVGSGFDTGGAPSGSYNETGTVGGNYSLQCFGTGTCTTSVSLSGTTCAGPSIVDIKANGSDSPIRVASTSAVTISWTASQVPGSSPTCTITENGTAIQTVTAGAPPTCSISPGSMNRTITTQTTYTINCGGTTDSVLVNVIPSFSNF